MFNRRTFLKSSSLVALAPTVPVFLRQTALAAESRRDEPVLVVIEMNGGNDGLNTVVPIGNDLYEKHWIPRPIVGIAEIGRSGDALTGGNQEN